MIFYFYHLLRKINKNHQFCSSWERIFQKKSRFAGKGLTVEASTSSSRDTQREILSPARISHCFPARGLRAPVVVPYFATRVYGHQFRPIPFAPRELYGLGRGGRGVARPREEGRKSRQGFLLACLFPSWTGKRKIRNF